MIKINKNKPKEKSEKTKQKLFHPNLNYAINKHETPLENPARFIQKAAPLQKSAQTTPEKEQESPFPTRRTHRQPHGRRFPFRRLCLVD